MANDVSKKIRNAVSQTRSQAYAAEREFDSEAELLQMKASRSIDLFGGSATSQVAEIVSTSCRICDTLYASYQSLIVTLDEECRPLLSQQPELSAVREVVELIQWLNSESEITNNFTASLNTSSLGDVASRSYRPSTECKMIQKYWETKYDQWPGRAEELARQRELAAQRAERRRLEEAKRQQEEEQRRNEQEAAYQRSVEEYELAVSARNELIAEIKQRHQKILRDRMEQEQSCRQEQIEQSSRAQMDAVQQQIDQIDEAMEDHRQELDSCKFFQSKKKKRCKKAIADHQRTKAQLERQLQELEMHRVAQLAKLPDQMKELSSQLAQEITVSFSAPPVPEKPRKPAPVISGMSSSNAALLQQVLEVLDEEEYLTISQIMSRLDMPELTNQRLSACIRSAVPDYIERTEQNYKAYFRKVT